MNRDQVYMQRAMELAKNGLGRVSPNPLVGCVIVYNEVIIIGEGWHHEFGGPHAEVNAINSVENKDLLASSTVYVNLEPCSHFGKTPPCVDLLIKHNVKRVAVANQDPNPKVAGAGIVKLKEAGVEVSEGVLKDEGLELNKRFFTSFNKKRPFIILKWAQTKDGFIARKDYDSKWISNESSRMLVHKWRSEEPTILVGYQTAYYDNPELTVRDWEGNNPTRLVIDLQKALPKNLKLFDQNHATICYNLKSASKKENLEFVIVDRQEVIDNLLEDLHQRDIQSILVEGGAATINQFLKLNLWDEARIFVSDQTFQEGIESPAMSKNIFAEEMIQDDRLLTYKNY